jgi:hypothetical protein
MKNDIKLILVATLIYAVFACLVTVLFWIFVKTNTLPLIGFLFTVWLLFIIFRTSKSTSAKRIQKLNSLWIQGLISEEELKALGDKQPLYREDPLVGGFYNWIATFRFYFRNIMNNSEKRLRNLEADRINGAISEVEYQAIRKMIVRNL